MTRLAIVSDIHGNMTALKAVLEDIASFAPDNIVLAGDAVNWGPHNLEVVELITREGWPVIRGNQEIYLLDQDTPRSPAEWDKYTISRWTREQLGPHWLDVIAMWPDALSLRFRDAPTLRVVHGSPRSHFEGIFPGIREEQVTDVLKGVEEETIVAGHTHLPLDMQCGRWHILNPGTVGMPSDGSMMSTYLILDSSSSGWHGTLRRVPFDPEPVLQDLERLQFAQACGVTGTLVLDEYRTSRLRVFPFNRWRKQFPDVPESELLRRFIAEVDPWDYTPMEYQVNR